MNVFIGFYVTFVCRSVCVAHMQEMHIGSAFKSVYTFEYLSRKESQNIASEDFDTTLTRRCIIQLEVLRDFRTLRLVLLSKS